MADEVSLAFQMPGEPGENLAAWRARAPECMLDVGYELVDESYETLVYEADVITKTMKILMWGLAKTLYRLSVTFRSDGSGATHVTLLGQAPEKTRDELEAFVTS